MPLGQLEGMNFRTGLKANGGRPVVERSEQLWSDAGIEVEGLVFHHGVTDNKGPGATILFPLKKAFDPASVTINADLGGSLSGGFAAKGKRAQPQDGPASSRGGGLRQPPR